MNIGFAGLLTLIFITLKLMGTIAWSWWWVLVPILWPIYITGIVFVSMAILTAFFAALEAIS